MTCRSSRSGGVIAGREGDLGGDVGRLPAPRAQPIAAGVHEDPVEPGFEPGRIPQRLPLAPRLDERVVGGVLCLGRVAQDGPRQSVGSIEVLVGERHERRVAPSGLTDGRGGGVGDVDGLGQAVHDEMTPERGESFTGRSLRPARFTMGRVYLRPAGSTWASVWAGANRSPTCSTRSSMSRTVQRFGRRSGSSSSSQVIGADTGAPAAGRTRVRRDERLDRRVLRVVEPRPALARLGRPLPRDEIRHGRPDRPRHLLDPVAGVREVVATVLDRDPDLDAALAGHLRDSRARRGAPAPSDTAAPGSACPPRSSSRPGRCRCRRTSAATARAACRSRHGSRSSPGCRASTATPRCRRSGGRWRCGRSRPSTPVSCQVVSQRGDDSGMFFCQKPWAPAPFGNRCRLSGRSWRCGSIVGAIRAK